VSALDGDLTTLEGEVDSLATDAAGLQNDIVIICGALPVC
jgi:hypothetical protein